MKRLSLAFAVVLGASIAAKLHVPNQESSITSSSAVGSGHQTEGVGQRSGRTRTAGASRGHDTFAAEASAQIRTFLQNRSGSGRASIGVIYATVPDPIRTHLAASFDANVAAIEDGIEDSGYLFDTAWLPWQPAKDYSGLSDSIAGSRLRARQLSMPGVLLFRRKTDTQSVDSIPDPYAHGLLVFLIAESPTSGISIDQVKSSVAILDKVGIPKQRIILFLGPNFSGSLSSFSPAMRFLAKRCAGRRMDCNIVVRSGSVTGDAAVAETLASLAATDRGLHVDFGSAERPYADWLQAAVSTLKHIGIPTGATLVLSEDESGFGRDASEVSRTSHSPLHVLLFPRDIGALRSSYERQGLLDAPESNELWRPVLHLRNENETEGDTIPSFGGDARIATQDSILFGIRAFIRSHEIRAVILVATNDMDRYFLTEFLHTYNSGVRVVVMGATRLFMRGIASQFRGDLMVSDYPMLARLGTWTSPSRGQRPQRLFADDSSEGSYMATRSLLSENSRNSNNNSSLVPPAEYTLPYWKPPPRALRSVISVPGMYVSVLGSDSAWPLSEISSRPLKITFTNSRHPSQPEAKAKRRAPKRSAVPDVSSISMPFAYGHGSGRNRAEIGMPGLRIATGHMWKALFWLVWMSVELYIAAISYSNPIARRKFSYLHPTESWRYWLLALFIPACLIGAAFLLLAWAHRFPLDVLANTRSQWNWTKSLLSSALAPLLLAITCVAKARHSKPALRLRNCIIAFAPAAFFIIVIIVVMHWHRHANFTLGQILNIYREMYLESGVSLVPTAFLLLAAVAAWAYFAITGSSLLRQSWELPQVGDNFRVSRTRGVQIVAAARPIPMHANSRWFWLVLLAVGSLIVLFCTTWPSIAHLTTLERPFYTKGIFSLGIAAVVLLSMDLVQFAWAWQELRDLLQALDRLPLKRSFVLLREFNWGGVWSFSSGSLQDRRSLIGAQLEALLKLQREIGFGWLDKPLRIVTRMRRYYSSIRLDEIGIEKYERDMRLLFRIFSNIGEELASQYSSFETQRRAEQNIMSSVVVNCSEGKGGFREEERLVGSLPVAEQLIERFLCLIYVAFIQTVIARLRGLAFSVVLVFSLVIFSIAVYPFEPILPLFVIGIGVLLVIAVICVTVYGQMDTDPLLSRVLKSDPSKLEGSFYGKLIETLLPPMLALGSAAVPGGAGRIIAILSGLVGH